MDLILALFEFIPPKLIGFLLSVGLIAAGVYMWIGGGAERALYDAAVGKEGKTYQAEIYRKATRSERTDGVGKYDSGSVDVSYLTLMYEEDGKLQSIDAQVDRDEYDAVKEDQTIQISFHPKNPEYVVTPMKNRPGVFWFRFGSVIFIALGGILVLMILVSLFAD